MSLCSDCKRLYGSVGKNSVNDCCYFSCATRYGVESNNTTFNPEYNQCARECKRCARDIIIAEGKDPAAYRLENPPIWVKDMAFHPSGMIENYKYAYSGKGKINRGNTSTASGRENFYFRKNDAENNNVCFSQGINGKACNTFHTSSLAGYVPPKNIFPGV